nr:hypothetical protein CFP56_73192 [Quercus suber]
MQAQAQAHNGNALDTNVDMYLSYEASKGCQVRVSESTCLLTSHLLDSRHQKVHCGFSCSVETDATSLYSVCTQPVE